VYHLLDLLDRSATGEPMAVGELVFSVQREGAAGAEPVLELRDLHALGDT